MTDGAQVVDKLARAFCHERCAGDGDPPCYSVTKWDGGRGCDSDVSCRKFAEIAAETIARDDVKP